MIGVDWALSCLHTAMIIVNMWADDNKNRQHICSAFWLVEFNSSHGTGRQTGDGYNRNIQQQLCKRYRSLISSYSLCPTAIKLPSQALLRDV